MKTRSILSACATLIAIALLGSGCGTPSKTVRVDPYTPLNMAYLGDIHEGERLVIGISDFEYTAPDISYEEDTDVARIVVPEIHPEVAGAERYYFPKKLKKTLQRTGYFDEVFITPRPSETMNIVLTGELMESNGRRATMRVTATDSSGKGLFSNTYKFTAEEFHYDSSRKDEYDAYQAMFNAVANDIVEAYKKMTPEERQRLRELSDVRFARDLSPDAFGGYILVNKDRYELVGLPAENDPLFEKVLYLKGVEYQFLSELNGFYTDLYETMWDPYLNWRLATAEATDHLESARAEQRSAQVGSALSGFMAIAATAASAYSSSQGVYNPALNQASAEFMGLAQQLSEQADYHSQIANQFAVEINNLGREFGAYLTPIVVEIEGRTYSLTGTADERYRSLREIMRRIYLEETGATASL